MNVVRSSLADVVGRNVAVVVGCVAAQDVFQIHLGFVQLLFSRSLTFGGKVRTAQRFVGQSAHCTGRTVNHNRFLTCFANGNLVSQAEVYFVVRYGRHDVLVFARVGNGFTQVHFVCIAVVCSNLQTFVQLVADFVQCFLNGMHRCTYRTVRLFDCKVRSRNGTVCTNSRIQRCCQRFDLADIHSIGVFRTFGYVGNLVAAVVQTGLGQGYGIGSIGNGQTISRQYAVTCGNFRRGQSGSGQNAVACLQSLGSYTVQRNVVFQFNFNAVCTRFGNHIFVVAFNCQRFIQFFGYGRAAIAVKGNTFGVDGCFCIHAFLNLSLGGVCKVKFVVGGFGLVGVCFFRRLQLQFPAIFHADGCIVSMDGVGRFITCFHSRNMGIVSFFNHAGFFAVGNSLIDGLCNIGSRGESIARLSSINRTVRTCCQCRFIDIERDGAVFVFGGRTCAVNEVQRGIVFSQRLSI